MRKLPLYLASCLIFSGVLASCEKSPSPVTQDSPDDREQTKVTEIQNAKQAATTAVKKAQNYNNSTQSKPLPFKLVGRAIALENGAIKFAWPGVYVEAEFFGDAIGLAFAEDSNTGFNAEENTSSYFDVMIDGQHHSTLTRPQSTVWIKDLAPSTNPLRTIRVTKRNEAPTVINNFVGFVTPEESKGEVKAPSGSEKRKFVFIGDSFTAGYGLESDSRECTAEKVAATTNSVKAFPALTAKNFNADYQQIAFSGRGIARNFAGFAGPTMYDLYQKIFPWQRSPSVINEEAADVVVIGLGINDFSTPIAAQENWTKQSLVSTYTERYHEMIDWVQAYYQPSLIVLSATMLAPDSEFPAVVKAIVQARQSRGDENLAFWQFGGLDFEGCDWHPSAADHRLLSDQLTKLLNDRLALN